MSNAKGPCNCGQATSLTGELEPLAELPSLEALSRDLEAAVSAEAGDDAEFEVALASASLTPEEEIAFAAIEEGESSSLDELLGVLERHPGLKITLSY
jgi:hypothetical protein